MCNRSDVMCFVFAAVAACVLAVPVWGFRANLAAGMNTDNAMRNCLAPIVKAFAR